MPPAVQTRRPDYPRFHPPRVIGLMNHNRFTTHSQPDNTLMSTLWLRRSCEPSRVEGAAMCRRFRFLTAR